jgi:hypothetical protein
MIPLCMKHTGTFVSVATAVLALSYSSYAGLSVLQYTEVPHTCQPDL